MLKKEITLFDATMLVAGTMIGSGIFIVSADMSRQLGSSGYLLLAWIITGVITMAGALSYGELSSMFPGSGGQYVYLKEAYGKLMAFLYGWTLFTVIQTGTIAAVGVAFAKFLGVFLPSVNDTYSFLSIGFVKVTPLKLVAISVIVFLSYINTKGVKYGKWIQNIFGSTKIIAIILLIVLGLFVGMNAEVISRNFDNMWSAQKASDLGIETLSGFALVLTIGTAMAGSLFSSDAWNNISFAGDEIINPKRTIPMSLAIGTGLVTLIYLLVNLVYLFVLPVLGSPEGQNVFERGIQYATNDRVATAVAEQIGGGTMVYVMAALIMVSTFGCNNGCILSGARVYYAMANDKLFFKGLAKLNKNQVPANALWMQCVWASLLCLSGSYGNLLDYVMFAVLLFYIFTIAGVFILRKKMPDAERPYKAFAYPYLPMLYIALVSVVVLIILTQKPEYTLPGLGIILLGVPVYYLMKNKI